MSEPRLIVLAGPTAVGKGTVAGEVRKHHPEIWISVSATTRPPRPGEIDGVHYHFISDEKFDEMVADNEFLEWAQVHNAYRYGTPRAPIDALLSSGQSALLEIDLQGARQVRAQMPSAFMVFLAPPTWEELVNRLIGRGTEDAAERERRLETAKRELAAQDEFDFVIVNTKVEEARDQLVDLFRSDSVG